MEKKIITTSIKELSEKGEGVAVIATLNVMDFDHDITLPGAFGDQVAPVVPAHDWQEAPIGKTRIHEVGNEVHAEFQLNLKTVSGRDWYEALKFDVEHPPAKQQYSYAFSIIEAEEGMFKNQRVRFLKKILVHEVSPVSLGAGIGTRTLALKDAKDQQNMGLKMAEQISRSIEYLENTVGRLEEIRDIRAQDGRKLSRDRLEDIVRLKALLERVGKLLADVEVMRTAEGVAAGYFDLRKKFAAGKSLTAMDNS